MKKIVFITALFLVSCSNNPVPKPDNLLDEEVMRDIIFDLSILQATDGAMPYKWDQNNIEMNQYIFQKYNIDSLTYYQNQKYYAADTKKYIKICKEVIERLENEKNKIVNQTSKEGNSNLKKVLISSE